MVAYSFRPRFVEPIRSGTKRQTIRADRKRHARPGETLQLYTGMRTRRCHLIGTSQCLAISTIFIHAAEDWVVEAGDLIALAGLDIFAQSDGFADWADMRTFWSREHPEAKAQRFPGVLIRWGRLL